MRSHLSSSIHSLSFCLFSSLNPYLLPFHQLLPIPSPHGAIGHPREELSQPPREHTGHRWELAHPLRGAPPKLAHLLRGATVGAHSPAEENHHWISWCLSRDLGRQRPPEELAGPPPVGPPEGARGATTCWAAGGSSWGRGRSMPRPHPRHPKVNAERRLPHWPTVIHAILLTGRCPPLRHPELRSHLRQQKMKASRVCKRDDPFRSSWADGFVPLPERIFTRRMTPSHFASLPSTGTIPSHPTSSSQPSTPFISFSHPHQPLTLPLLSLLPYLLYLFSHLLLDLHVMRRGRGARWARGSGGRVAQWLRQTGARAKPQCGECAAPQLRRARAAVTRLQQAGVRSMTGDAGGVAREVLGEEGRNQE